MVVQRFEWGCSHCAGITCCKGPGEKIGRNDIHTRNTLEKVHLFHIPTLSPSISDGFRERYEMDTPPNATTCWIQTVSISWQNRQPYSPKHFRFMKTYQTLEWVIRNNALFSSSLTLATSREERYTKASLNAHCQHRCLTVMFSGQLLFYA